MVLLRVQDVLESHADGDQLVPGGEGGGLEEVGGVIRGKGLVYLEGGDFCGDCGVLVEDGVLVCVKVAYCGVPSRSCRRRLPSR